MATDPGTLLLAIGATSALVSTSCYVAHQRIGRSLQRLYDEVAAEPIPERLRRLVDRLGEKGASDADAS